ncbi:MAG: glycoside hydrolase/phage tail family protein [Pseudomonadota bacterium]
MATIVLSAAGGAIGASLGGSILGLSGAVIGRAAGAALGQVIDGSSGRIVGGSDTVSESARVERLFLMAASEGQPLGVIYGQSRVAGQVIWSSEFLESQDVSTQTVTSTTQVSGGKGAPGSATATQTANETVITYSYSISLALALGEGEVNALGRIWADGAELTKRNFNIRLYPGSDTQLPDPKIEAIEGAGNAPAYRGTAYVVIEDMPLEQFGNRVPQLSFEVIRPARPEGADAPRDIAEDIQAMAIVPGTGEYALATQRVSYDLGLGRRKTANVNSASKRSDMVTSTETLMAELPALTAASLVVCWFGDDLRASECTLRPKVEQKSSEAPTMPWRVSGLNRTNAQEVPRVDGRPVYGGTPTDLSVVQAISRLAGQGKAVMYYPFILMDQLEDNALPNPLDGGIGQPALPWRGRITTSLAAGLDGSPDGTATAAAEVAAFFGTAAAGDFSWNGSTVVYSGPAEWSYRRFILHQAHLCAAAGGVGAFCIGSEMRGLTRIRGAANSFPAVSALKTLAADVRQILPDAKITYAADWSEYFGYHPQDGTGDVFFHLDPLWADANIDMVGIDNYMPISDWRDGFDHADAAWKSIYSLDYLKANILGGEGYDWFYPSPEEEVSQRRAPITDGAHGEPWVFRYKDLPSWWANAHHDRIGGVRQTTPTAWIPQSKPIWFTEYGCSAIDKGTNQPNKFLDPKSSESVPPKFSNGRRDDFLQQQYIRAMLEFWADGTNNPVSDIYGAPMLDLSRAFVWAWDARPYPAFPNRDDVWSDGANWTRGHWISGRIGAQSLASVVADLCERAGVADYDVSELYGLVRGYTISETGTTRSALQPLMRAHAFDVSERDGKLVFRTRDGAPVVQLNPEVLAVSDELNSTVERIRAPQAEIAGRLRLNYTRAGADFSAQSTEAIFPDEVSRGVEQSDLPMVLNPAEARAIVERWLAEARVARDTVRLALPPSQTGFGAGDVVALPDSDGTMAHFRIDRTETSGLIQIEATRVERNIYAAPDAEEDTAGSDIFNAPEPVLPIFLDLPLLTGDEVVDAPHLAVAGDPWPGEVAVLRSSTGDGFSAVASIGAPSIIGMTLNDLPAAMPSVLDRGPGLRVQFSGGSLASAEFEALLNGANAAAIGDGSPDGWEIFQFQNAELGGENTYELTLRLRGQAGTEGLVPTVWPVGSTVVMLTPAVQQIPLRSGLRGLSRIYRIGPAGEPVDDPSFVEIEAAFDGVGLRPYAPVHLRAVQTSPGDIELTWIRRSRIDGDSWQSYEVPLGEERELYIVRVRSAGAVLREAETETSGWVYSAADQAADGATGPLTFEVAQVSDRFGPGLFGEVFYNG